MNYNKPDLRRRMRALRQGLRSREAAALSLMAQQRLLALYASAKGELQTDLLLREGWRLGKTVFLPRVETRPGPGSAGRMVFARCLGPDQLRPGAFGILEPESAAGLSDLRTGQDPAWPPDLFILPGLAFDRQGRRLGWGGGFYDSFLSGAEAGAKAAVPPEHPGGKEVKAGHCRVGLAYSFQLLDALPAQEWDIAVNAGCTDKEFLWIRRNQSS